MAFQPLSNRALEAARTNDISLLTKLFKNHIKKDIKDENGDTAVSIAVRNNHPKIVKMLLEYGFNVNTVNHQLMTPLHLAASQGNEAVLLILLEHKADARMKNHEGLLAIDYCKPVSRAHEILYKAKQGTLSERYEEIIEVPVIPAYSIPKPPPPKDKSGKKDKKKKGKKKK